MLLRHKEKIYLIVLSDILAMLIGFTLALAFGHRNPMTLSFFSLYRLGVFTLVTSVVILFVILDVYSLHRMPSRFTNQMLVIGVGLLISAVVATAIFFFFRDPVPRAVFILFYLFTWLLIGIFRYLHSRVTLSRIYWRMILVGDMSICETISSLIQERNYIHAQVVGCIAAETDSGSERNMSVRGETTDLMASVLRDEIDQVVVAVPSISPSLMKDLLECMKHKVKVSDYKQVIEEITGKVPIEYLSANWFIEELSGLEKRYTWYSKRVFDVFISVIGILLASPIVLLAALLIRLESRGPFFYSQIRIGRGNKRFRVWKLRTMVADADSNNVFWTNDNDERVTHVGWLLRKMHIDELPQFFNILKGDMSLIGPRPEAEALVKLYMKEIPYYQERHMVTPGVTGWAQINYSYGNSIEDTREKLKYDFYYIKNRGLLLDLLIFLRTIKTVVTGKGAL
jgi:exopolysaccharide biosynthesis polyprenyl glycosylphosphotransferase